MSKLLLVLVLLAVPALADEPGLPLGDVPAQREGDPFAAMTLSVDTGVLLPRADTWSLPVASGQFASVASKPLVSTGLSIGALHFFGHADILVMVPLVGLSATLDTPLGPRKVSTTYSCDTVTRIYPAALRPGTVRPFFGFGLGARRFTISDSADATANSSGVRTVVLPVSAGLGWRSTFGTLLTVGAEYRAGDTGTLFSGVVPQNLYDTPQPLPSQLLDLGGWRLVLSLAANFDLSPQAVRAGFRQREAAAWQKRIDTGHASGFTLGFAPSSRIENVTSPYFAKRPYLEGPYDEPPFFHGTAGYYVHTLDTEFRLAFRSIAGAAKAHGAQLQTRQTGVFAEVVRFFDPDLYGFVPFIGAGVGMQRLTATDTAANIATTNQDNKWAPDIVFGWDIRPAPSYWWILRTNLRWLPAAPLGLGNTTFDFGGLEYDFIQLIVYPGRLGAGT